MKPGKSILFIFLCLLIVSPELFSQTDKEQIEDIRNASNTALKSYDQKKVLSNLTDDVLTTSGKFTLLCGKSRMYWIRNTQEILVNQNQLPL